MADLKTTFERLKVSKKEATEIKKAFKDSLMHDRGYQDLIERVKGDKEKIKSIENAAWAQNNADAARLDSLKLDIKSDRELLSSIALTDYVAGRTVEVIDDLGARHVPEFNVNMKKSGERQEKTEL